MSKEVWKDVVGYEGFYEVSSLGNVRRGRTVPPACGSTFVGKVLKPGMTHDGYRRVALSRDGVVRHFTVHRLVAFAFLVRPAGEVEVNHKSGIKADNRPENLEWCSNAHNQRHATVNGLRPSGDRHGLRMRPWRAARGDRHSSRTHPERVARGERQKKAKLTDAKVLELRKLRSKGWKLVPLARRFGVSVAVVSKVSIGETWAHVGGPRDTSRQWKRRTKPREVVS